MKLAELLERLETINLAHQKLQGSLVQARDKFKWGITVPGDFLCNDNQLTTLDGIPDNVIGICDVSNNQLKNLKNCPLSTGRSFMAKHNRINTLEFTPHYIRGDFDVSDNLIQHLEGIEETLGTVKGKIILSGNPIKAHISGLLKVKGLQEAVFSDRNQSDAFSAFLVINKYLQKTEDLNESLTASNLVSCEEELTNKGLSAFI